MADDFCQVSDAKMAKYTIKPEGKRQYHRDSTLSKAEAMVIMILFHDSGYRCLKNIAQIEHSRHRSIENFIVNALAALAAYCLFPKKPSIMVDRYQDRQL